MIKVNSSQFNYMYGDQLHMPYSIAMLISYIKSKPELASFKFEKTFVIRDRVEDYINQCSDTEILLCSCYVWNWEITNHLAKSVKERNPGCLVIFGGPQVPEDTTETRFFEAYPHVDIAVHGEGKLILENIFKAYVNNTTFNEVSGISTKNFTTSRETRIKDLDTIPSPYLTGLVWELVEKEDWFKWICSWETNRGCPFQCTFCDWGSATYTKLRKFSEERLYKEIEWFSDNKIIYIDCCDGNFGIFVDRDFRIAQKIKEQVLLKGFPQKVRPSWAKNSSDKIIPIAKEFKDGNFLGAVTLAVQSLDETTLDLVKRANIKFDKFSTLVEDFRSKGIATYTELILGLPGETLESFKKGLEIIGDTKISSVFIYNCGVLPNAPMNAPSYRKQHGIQVMRSPIMLTHSFAQHRGIQEFEDIVVSTKYCDNDMLKEKYLYGWMFLTFQSLGILEYVCDYFKYAHNLPRMKFYEMLLNYCRSSNSVFAGEYKKVVAFRDAGYAGKGWDHYDAELGEIIWPIESASWLRITNKWETSLQDLRNFVDYVLQARRISSNFHAEIMGDLLEFQSFVLTLKSDKTRTKEKTFLYDWKSFFKNKLTAPEKREVSYNKTIEVLEQDPVLWNYKTIWYGRKGRHFMSYPEDLQDIGLPRRVLTEV